MTTKVSSTEPINSAFTKNHNRRLCKWRWY